MDFKLTRLFKLTASKFRSVTSFLLPKKLKNKMASESGDRAWAKQKHSPANVS
jgi:hypothetical protein